jgi:hypothetical protein
MLLLYRSDCPVALGAAALLISASIFSHEAGVAIAPLFLIAGLVAGRSLLSPAALIAIAATGASLAGWRVAKALVDPDPIIALTVGDNARGFSASAPWPGIPRSKRMWSSLCLAWPRPRSRCCGRGYASSRSGVSPQAGSSPTSSISAWQAPPATRSGPSAWRVWQRCCYGPYCVASNTDRGPGPGRGSPGFRRRSRPCA